MKIQGVRLQGTKLVPSGAAVAPDLEVSRSLRFNSADSAYLNRTPASASNRKTWTWSGWVKRSGLDDAYQAIFEVFNGNNDNQTLNINFQGSSFGGVRDAIAIGAYNLNWLVTTAVYRDPSAWYHIVLAVDTTQATANNRIRLYVNGSEVTAFGTRINPTQNDDLAVNQSAAHHIGSGNTRNYFNGYLTEINFIDGQQLTPSSFGETDADTGVWNPKAYTGTYGTNGFYLNFSDNSGTTSTTLGKDSSGNGNNWTPNNFSVTAGVGNDSLVDSPTNYGTDTGAGGEVRGNYCTWNPLAKSAAVVLSNGNLGGSSDASLTGGCSGTIAVTSGKWYWETTIITFDGASAHGILKLPATNYATSEPGSYKYLNGGDVRIGDGSNVPYGASYGAGDVVGVALDLDNGKVFFSKNGVFQNSGNPVSGTNPAFSSLSGEFTAWCQDGSFTQIDTWATNFGQRAFAYTAPSGFKALCTQNLPTPTIGATSTTQATDYFNTVIWTGNGTNPRSITGIGFQPDMVWSKSRSQPYSHGLYDVVRGAGGNKRLYPNETYPENGIPGAEGTAYGSLTSFDSDGFSVNAGTVNNIWFNSNNETYVAWNWKANGAGSTNTAGTITSTVSASTTSGFSIATFTKTGTTSETIGHGLGIAPSMVIVKTRQNSGYTSWAVWHTSIGIGNYLELNTTAASQASSTIWNNTLPTSTVFSMGTAWTSTQNMVAYCFANVEGYSRAFSYTGNGSTDGPFVFTDHRPAFLLVKRTDTTSNWTILDFQREGYNVDNDPLFPNLSNAEGTTDLADLLSSGFKLRSTDASVNASGGTYIYMSVASNPFKYARAR